jgi:hypothetical protein
VLNTQKENENRNTLTCDVLVVPPEAEVLGLIVTVAVLGWNEVKVC